MTFWNVNKTGREELAGINRSELDQGDMFLGWKANRETARYVHISSDDEINDVITILKTCKLKLIDRYISDKSKKSFNLYLVFKKG